jgi:molybdenum cofactor cytidylyltransferase
MMECANIAVAVLAAGQARRFGSDKLMADLDGVPLGAYIARTFAPMGFGWRFAVCATDAPIAKRFAASGFTIVENSQPETGQSHSLHLAIAAAQETGAKALLVALADMPYVTADHIGALTQEGGLAASYDGVNVMPPALFPRDSWPELLRTSGDAGARQLLVRAHRLPAPPGILRDIDTQADLPASK